MVALSAETAPTANEESEKDDLTLMIPVALAILQANGGQPPRIDDINPLIRQVEAALGKKVWQVLSIEK
jgi:hypothetical protein